MRLKLRPEAYCQWFAATTQLVEKEAADSI